MRTSIAQVPGGPVEYRVAGHGDGWILALHGAHLSATSDVGVPDLVREGRRVLVVSRPGYGRTPASSGQTRARFVTTLAGLTHHLGIPRFDAVVGMSAGGGSALGFAARHPELTGSLVLQSAMCSGTYGVTSFFPSLLAFNPLAEPFTWAALRTQLDVLGRAALATFLGSLSTVSGHDVLADLRPGEERAVANMLKDMRSSSGYLLDVLEPVDAHDEQAVRAPTLVVGSPYDGQISFAHARHLAATIPGARLCESTSRSHLVWFGSGVPAMRREVAALLRGA